MAVADDTFTIKIGIKNPVYAIISKCDEELISGSLRYVFDKYAYMGTESLQSVIMGPRPDDVPEDWVIDHKNRNKLDNTHENLRWVSKSFNSWNCVRKDPRLTEGSTSRFKGVSKKDKTGPQWRARGISSISSTSTSAGFHHTEREAAIASATAYVRAYGEWAETSDLLVSEDQSLPDALLSPEEMREIVMSISAAAAAAAAAVVVSDAIVTEITKEKGVEKLKNGRFKVQYRKKWVGSFGDFESAVACRRAHVAEVQEREWQDHLLLQPTKDRDGDVAIALKGDIGKGRMSKVDLCFWHLLTYKQSWNMNQQGYARCAKKMLHTAVMLLVDPKYVPSRDASIDHRDPDSKLDNRANNLRVATNLEQQRNKVKRTGTSSLHLGVSAALCGWAGCFSYTTSDGPQRYRVNRPTQEAVVALLNAKRLEIHGDKAVLG
jgi:hypothetical protein